MAMAYTLLFLLAVALLAISMAGHKVVAGEHEDDLYQASMSKSQGSQGILRSYQCPSECSRRCKMTQYKKPCLFFCNKCCNTCLCVPTGYYGNKGECPCYNNWKTKRGGPKCP